MNINVRVTEGVAQVQGAPVYVCGRRGDTVTFTLDAEWDKTSAKKARFSWELEGVRQYTDVEVFGTVAEIPPLVDIRAFYVGLYAGDVKTSTDAKVRCLWSALCGHGTQMIKGDKGEPGEAGAHVVGVNITRL